jgi:N-acetylglucosaminyldiphosphoundecaprenol N-acetyl-beta-D-mannosaminyltransferase
MNSSLIQQTPSASQVFRVAGVRINAVTLLDVVTRIREWVHSDHPQYICLTGAHGIVEMQSNMDLASINERAGLVTPDGTPIVWLGRFKGFHLERVCASNLMPAIFRDGLTYECRHFFLGSTPSVAQRLVARTKARHPGIRIVGWRSPPFGTLSSSDRSEIVEHINSSRANVVWVGLGYPKQERFMSEFRPLLDCSVMVGVGAGFDFLSGAKPLAPSWVSSAGFEWLFRALTDPKTVGRRAIRVVPMLIYLVLRDLARSLAGKYSATKRAQ